MEKDKKFIPGEELFPRGIRRGLHYTQFQREALRSIVKDLRLGGLNNQQIAEALPEVSMDRIMSTVSLLIRRGEITRLSNRRKYLNNQEAKAYDMTKLTDDEKLVRLFIPLYQAHKSHKGNSGIPGQELDKILQGEEYDSDVMYADRERLVGLLRERLQSLGIHIESVIDTKDGSNIEAGSYRLIFTHPVFETDLFLRLALLENAHKKQPIQVTDQQWTRQRNVLGIYYGSQATTTDIARLYGFTNRQMPSSIIERGMRNLWKNCSPELQSVFPVEDLQVGKPAFTRKKEPLISDGTKAVISEPITGGISSGGILKNKELRESLENEEDFEVLKD